MKKLSLSFLVLMSLLIIAPNLQAQQLVCEEANGLEWCYNPNECGQACNEVCAVDGREPIESNTEWLEAQNTEEKCIAISEAFGLGNTVIVNSFTFACLVDVLGFHSGEVALISPISCSTAASCPETHRTMTESQGEPCDNEFSSRAICPCEPPPPPPPPPAVPTLTQWGLIAMAAILGLVGFMVIRRRKVTT